MEDIKAWYCLKAVWGALIAILASLLQYRGVELGGEEQNAIVEALVTLSGTIGGLLALYGRLSATRAIGKP